MSHHGLEIIRCLIAQGLAKAPGDAEAFATKRWGNASLPARIMAGGGLVDINFDIAKSFVGPASTLSGSWGEELTEAAGAAAELFALVRERSVLGRIPGLRPVPLRVKTVGMTAGFSAAWVAEGRAVPVSSAVFAELFLEPLKVNALTVATEETLSAATPATEIMLRDDLVGAVAEALNASFLDPANAGEAGVEPPSVTNGAPSITATGDGLHDLRELIDAFPGNLETATLVGSAEALVAMHDPIYLPGLGARGGQALGIPAIAVKGAGMNIALIDGPGVAYGGGGITARTAREGSIEMRTDPTQNPMAPGTGSELVSLWQTNMVAIMSECQVAWEAVRPSVAVLEAVPAS